MESEGLAMAEFSHGGNILGWKRLEGSKTAKGIYTSGYWHGLSIRLFVATVDGNANENYLKTFQLERGRETLVGAGRTCTNAFSID